MAQKEITENGIMDRISTLEKRLVEYPEDEHKTINLLTRVEIDIKKRELEDVKLINSYSGRMKKAVKIIKKIHEDWLDEKSPDDKDVQKVKAYLNRERTDLEFKKRELEEKINKLESIEYYTQNERASSWWMGLERNREN